MRSTSATTRSCSSRRPAPRCGSPSTNSAGWNSKPAWGPGTRRRVQPAEIHPDPDAVGRHASGTPISRLYGVCATARAGFCIRPARRRASTPSSRPRRSASARCRTGGFEPRNEWLEVVYRQARTAALPRRDRRRAGRAEASAFLPSAAPAVMPRAAPAPEPRSRSPRSAPIPSTCWHGGNATPTA